MDLETGSAHPDLGRPDLVWAAGVGIMSLDATGRIASANAAAIDMLGCDETDLVGAGAHESLHRELPGEDCAIETAVRAGVARHVDDDTFIVRGQPTLPVWWATTPLRSTDTGTLIGAVLVFGDTTQRRARAMADAAEHDQRGAELAEAQRNVSDLEWIAEITQALSSSLDETEVMRRLARIVVSRFGGIAVVGLIDNQQVVTRVGGAAAPGVDVDLGALLAPDGTSHDFEPGSTTYRTVTAAPLLHLGPEQFTDPDVLSAPSRELFRAAGATDALTVQLTARGHPVGVLGLLRTGDSAPFSEIDQIIAVDIGHRAALAVDNARLYRAQTEISLRLQQALLPPPPTSLLVHAAVRYLPARNRFEVGGDWYDLFRCSADSDTTLLVVGDVAGHDLAAGTTMSALRNLLRGVAVTSDGSPAEVIESVDASLSVLDIQGTATTLVMAVRPDPATGGWSLEWSNAGHLPPVLFLPDGTVDMFNEVHGPMLGTGTSPDRRLSRRSVPAGSTVLLYTDGLVENRGESIDAGLTRLRMTALARQSPADDPDAVADELLLRNHASTEDDTVLLVCHLPAF